MAPSAIAQRRTHNLLLFQKLLNLRDGASPFTLLLDTLEQSGQPVVQEFMARAKHSHTKIIFISFQTLRQPKHADVFISARRKQLEALGAEISSHLPRGETASLHGATTKSLLVFDTLLPLAFTVPAQLPPFLSGLLSPTTSVIATYHTDVPVPVAPPLCNQHRFNPYSPDALTTLMFLATAILRVSNLSQAIEKKRARDRSLEEPVFGLEEGREGVLVGLQGWRGEAMNGGLVLEMEIRRKSGRGVRDVFVLSTSTVAAVPATPGGVPRGEPGGKLCLLDDHPLYAAAPATAETSTHGSLAEGAEGDEVEMTFSLGLTEKQRRDREGVVLPYFDAQRAEGGGDGGRILYEMDRVDDFDEEEDEI